MRHLLVTLAAGAASGLAVDVAGRVVEAQWRRRNGRVPTKNPFGGEGGPKESLRFALLVTAVVVMVRSLTTKGATKALSRSERREHDQDAVAQRRIAEHRLAHLHAAQAQTEA